MQELGFCEVQHKSALPMGLDARTALCPFEAGSVIRSRTCGDFILRYANGDAPPRQAELTSQHLCNKKPKSPTVETLANYSWLVTAQPSLTFN